MTQIKIRIQILIQIMIQTMIKIMIQLQIKKKIQIILPEDGEQMLQLKTCKELANNARVGLAPGITFGAREDGWLRLCFANQIDTLNMALDRLEQHLPS